MSILRDFGLERAVQQVAHGCRSLFALVENVKHLLDNGHLNVEAPGKQINRPSVADAFCHRLGSGYTFSQASPLGDVMLAQHALELTNSEGEYTLELGAVSEATTAKLQ